jgi:hypothetical protein
LSVHEIRRTPTFTALEQALQARKRYGQKHPLASARFPGRSKLSGVLLDRSGDSRALGWRATALQRIWPEETIA